jgi:hypothetical protein
MTVGVSQETPSVIAYYGEGMEKIKSTITRKESLVRLKARVDNYERLRAEVGKLDVWGSVEMAQKRDHIRALLTSMKYEDGRITRNDKIYTDD